MAKPEASKGKIAGQLATVKLAVVKPYWRNPRKNDEAAKVVATNIDDVGYVVPIVVDKDYVIIAGHSRYKALQALGADDVDVIVADMTARQAKKHRIADNKIGEVAKWNLDELMIEIREAGIEDLKPYFPDLNIEAATQVLAGVNYNSPTPEAIEEQQSKNDNRFQSITENRQKDELKLTCPHCAEDYTISRAAILRAIG